MTSVSSAVAEAGRGLLGDRYHGSKHRHVTVQSQEQLDLAASEFGATILAAGTRRNVTVTDGAIPTLPGTRLRLGDALLEVVRVAAPCRLLDDNLGPGAAAALRHKAGSVCRVLETGSFSVGDPVIWATPAALAKTP